MSTAPTPGASFYAQRRASSAAVTRVPTMPGPSAPQYSTPSPPERVTANQVQYALVHAPRSPLPGELWASVIDIDEPIIHTMAATHHLSGPSTRPRKPTRLTPRYPCMVLGELPGDRYTVAPLGFDGPHGKGGSWDDLVQFFVVPVLFASTSGAADVEADMGEHVRLASPLPALWTTERQCFIGQSTVLPRAALRPLDGGATPVVLDKDGVRQLLLLCARLKLEFRRLPRSKVELMKESYLRRLHLGIRNFTPLAAPDAPAIRPTTGSQSSMVSEASGSSSNEETTELDELQALAEHCALMCMRPSFEGSSTRRAMQRLRRAQAGEADTPSSTPTPPSKEDATMEQGRRSSFAALTPFGWKGQPGAFDWTYSPPASPTSLSYASSSRSSSPPPLSPPPQRELSSDQERGRLTSTSGEDLTTDAISPQSNLRPISVHGARASKQVHFVVDSREQLRNS